MTTTLRAAVVAMVFAALAGSIGRSQEVDAGGKIPSLTLAVTPGSGKILTSGTLDLKGLTFDKITVFAVNQSGGFVYKEELKIAPTGQNWPSTGTLDITGVSDGDYNVWAVLEVKENKTFYGSTLSKAKVGNGGTGPGSYINWSAVGPVAGAGATITGDGTYSRPAKHVTVDVQMMVVDSAGGPFQVKTTTLNENVNPWAWKSETYTVTGGRTYNVFAVHSIKPAEGEQGVPFQHAASVKAVAVGK